MTRTHIWLIVLILVTAAAPAGAGYPILAVDRFDDDPTASACTDAPGDCSLRGAVLAAGVDGGRSEVRLEAGTYLLTVAGADEDQGWTGDLDVVDEDLLIRGAGAGTTVIDASVLGDRALDVPYVPGREVEVVELTIRGGDADAKGGGVRAFSRLELRDAEIRDCSAGQGGGVFSGVELVVSRSTLADNSAGQGAGLSVTGAVSIEESTVSDNTATGDGGAIEVQGISGSVDLLNSTLSGNLAGNGDALYVGGGSVGLEFVTIVSPDGQSGSALVEDGLGTVTFADTAVVGSCLGNGFSTLGGNLESPGGTCGFNLGSDQDGVSEPRLSGLGDWGGPTRTHRPYPGSPLIEAGVAGACAATDQRGVARPIDGDGGGDAECDTGAHEADFAFDVEFVVDRADDDPAAATCSDGLGDCSLRGAILAANALAGVDTVRIPPGRYALSSTGAEGLGGDLDVEESLLVRGATAEHTIIDASGVADRAIQLAPGVHLSLHDVTVQGGSAPDGGGIDGGFGSLSVYSSVIRDNVATSDGGGIRVLGDLTLGNSTVAGNQAADGGGLWVAETTVIQESTVSGNSATGAGGGVFNDGASGIADLDVAHTTIAFNTAASASAIRNVGGTVEMQGSLMEGGCTGGGGASLGGNLESPGSSCGLTEPTDQAGVPDPMLAPLESVLGYPPSHRPLPTSPAIDSYSCLSGADQQGFPRPLDGDGDQSWFCDSGASEAPRRLVVTTTDDHDDGVCNAGDCTLREAVRAANADALPTTNGLDEIVLPSGVFTLSVTGAGEDEAATGDLDVLDDLVVDGDPAGGSVIDGLNADRVFHLPLPETISLILSDVTVRNGNADDGGGIRAGGDGSLWVERSSVLDCSASNIGGAIYSNGVVLLRRATLADNEATGSGGAIFLAAAQALAVSGSTVSGNTSTTGTGGAIASTGGGLVEIRSSTVAGNLAATGGSALAVSVGNEVALSSTLIEGSCSGTASALFTSYGGNLESPGSSCGLDAPTDLVAVSDPGLEPLADHGGQTPTHALAAGSPALDAGLDAGSLPVDQRGVGRPVDGDGVGGPRSDIGAVERPAPAGPEIFADGFEGGSTAMWSAAVG